MNIDIELTIDNGKLTIKESLLQFGEAGKFQFSYLPVQSKA